MLKFNPKFAAFLVSIASGIVLHLELPVQAAIIGEWVISNGSGGTRFAVAEPTIDIDLGFGNACVDNPFSPSCFYLFEDLKVSSEDIGKSFTVTASDDPDFDSIVNLLTNGLDDQWTSRNTFIDVRGIEFVFSSTSEEKGEQEFLFPKDRGNRVDFSGFSIEQFTLKIDFVRVETPGSDPNGDGIWTDQELNARLIIEGQEVHTSVSEPTAPLSLLATSILGIFSMKKRKQSR